MMFRVGGSESPKLNLFEGHTNAQDRHLDYHGAKCNSHSHETNE